MTRLSSRDRATCAGLRAAVLYPVPLFFDGRQYSSDSVTFRSILDWGSRFASLDVITYVRPATGTEGRFPIDAANVRIVKLSSSESRVRLYLTKAPLILFEMVRLIAKGRRRWDAVILFDSAFPNWVAYFACKLFRVPVVLRMVGRYDLFVQESLKFEGPLKKLLGTLYGAFIRRFQVRAAREKRIVTDGDCGFANAEDRPGVGFCVETHLSETTLPRENPYARRRRGDEFRVLSVSRIHPVKGVHVLVGAVASLNRRGVPVALDIAGPTYGWKYGDYEDRIRRQVADAGIERIRFHGFLREGRDVDALWAGADAFVVPYTSNADGVPRVIFEAMTHGVPVIAARIGGIPRALRDGETGLLVAPGDEDGLARAIESLRNDEAKRRRLSEGAFAAAREHTTEAVSGKLAAKLCETALRGRSREGERPRPCSSPVGRATER